MTSIETQSGVDLLAQDGSALELEQGDAVFECVAGYQGDYDPTAFDQLDPTTWPNYPGPYCPGQWWRTTAAATIDGDDVDVGDRMYPIGRGRLFGELNYGDEQYGGAPPEPPWPADSLRVRWVGRLFSSAPGWDRPPSPYDGCTFLDQGWRVCVEAFYNDDPAVRTYGSGLYGGDVFGDVNGIGEMWHDITTASFGALIRWGSEVGDTTNDVGSLSLDLLDLDATIATMRPQLFGLAPDVPVRVSLIDPEGEPWPLFTGRCDEIADEHEQATRIVTVDAFSMESDLATIDSVDRPGERVTTRLDHYVRLAEYSWGRVAYPTTNAVLLRRTDPQIDTNLRELIDTASLSVGWLLASDTYGRLRWLTWPLAANGDAVQTTDQLGAAGLPVANARLAGDRAELLNEAEVVSEEVQGAVEIRRVERDAVSIGRLGRRNEQLGFPLTGLSSYTVTVEQLAAAAVERYGRVAYRLASIDVDVRTDERWLAVLARLDYGLPIRFTRTKPTPLVMDALVCGAELSLTRDRLSATLYLTTTTETAI